MTNTNKTIKTAALTILLSLMAVSNAFAVWENDYSTNGLFYTSTKKVVDLNGDVSSIAPAIDNSKIPYGNASDYMTNSSCLGYYGPLGPYGPLGTLGPIGDNTWNVSYWMDTFSTWTDWKDEITGPLGPEGPLGEAGPVANDQYYGILDPGFTLFQTNDFARHSRGLGIWNAVGPLGPLGALGALGPLGPIGAHGYTANGNGEYVDANGDVKRNITIWYDGSQTEQRTYDLYEKYTEDFAKNMTDNDTSFMVTGKSSSYSDVDTYAFTSSQDQLVSVVIVPEKQLDDFDLTIVDENDNVIATSNTGTFIDAVQLKVPAGTTLKAKVTCYWSGHYLSSTYRLFVTGSTENLNKTEITGDHIDIY